MTKQEEVIAREFLRRWAASEFPTNPRYFQEPLMWEEYRRKIGLGEGDELETPRVVDRVDPGVGWRTLLGSSDSQVD